MTSNLPKLLKSSGKVMWGMPLMASTEASESSVASSGAFGNARVIHFPTTSRQ